MMQLLKDHDAVLFAAAIPRRIARPASTVAQDYLRNDQVFLLDRFFYSLESRREHGLLVMDKADKAEDRRFVSRSPRYFTKTAWPAPRKLVQVL